MLHFWHFWPIYHFWTPTAPPFIRLWQLFSPDLFYVLSDMRLPSCNVVGIRLTARRMLKVAIRPRFDRPPENFQVQRVKYKEKPKILKNDQGPLKRVKNMFSRYVTFLTFLANVPFLNPHSSPIYTTMTTIFTRSLLRTVWYETAKLQRYGCNINCTAIAQSSHQTSIWPTARKFLSH